MSFFLTAPFSEEQQRNINTYQRDSVMSPLVCDCGKILYAVGAGMECSSCLKIKPSCPKFIANGSWRWFKKKKD